MLLETNMTPLQFVGLCILGFIALLMFVVFSGGGWSGASGNNSLRVQRILKDDRLKWLFMDYCRASKEEREKYFEIIFEDDGYYIKDIIDRRSKGKNKTDSN